MLCLTISTGFDEVRAHGAVARDFNYPERTGEGAGERADIHVLTLR